jgi:predicted nucleotide-binding protein (sugar kinase/HSP70/actin superfamily)
MPRIAVPMMGNYSIVFAASLESLRVEPWTMASSNEEILKLGLEASPESACMPFKVYTGHFIKAATEGVEYAVMVNSCGTCRLRYYQAMQRKLLADMGFKIRVFGIGQDGWKPPMIRFFDPDLWPFLKSVLKAYYKLKAVDAIEIKSWNKRPRELNRGDTTRVTETLLKKLRTSDDIKEIKRILKNIEREYEAIPVDPAIIPLRIALVGEATVLRDPFLNHDIERRLGNLGAEVRNFFLLGEELRKIFTFRVKNRFAENLKVTKNYLHSIVGGHALETIANSIRCAKEGYDGAIHICPNGCMPEVSMRPILKKISHDFNFPILEISVDEHTSGIGIQTRLEAFVEILKEKQKT